MTKPAELIHAMAERSMRKLRVAFVLPGGVLSALSAAKSIKMEDGGPDISNPIMVGGNPNVGPATYYDKVPVTRTSELSTVRYEMTRVVGTYVISDQEIDENSGTAKIVDIAAAKMQGLEIAIKKYQRKNIVGTNSGKNPLGLGNLLPGVNTSGSVGGVNLAVQPLWQHAVYLFNGSLTAANIEQTFDDILLDLHTEDGKISMIAAGRNIFTLHRNAARAKGAVELPIGGFGKTLANLGLVATTHQQIPLVYDEEMDPDFAYFLNQNEIFMHILKGANMKLKDLTAPYDQDVVGKRYVSEYQLCSWKQYRTHGFVSNKA